MRPPLGAVSRSPGLGIYRQRGTASAAPAPPPHVPDFNSPFARRALLGTRFPWRPILMAPDGTIDAGDRMVLSRRGYGRES